MSYFQRVRNIGDLLAPYIVEHVTQRPTVSARSTEHSYLLSIGSLLQTTTRRSFVWGTGLIHPSADIGDPDARRVLAVRGKLTYAELVRNGVRVGDVPFGDPAFLIPRLLQQSGSASPRFPLGLVPHFVDRDHPFFLEAAKDPSIKVLDVCDPADVFFAELASCGAIASSSLHGLVFGEALGLPTLWLEVSDKVLGERFKFADWFSLSANPQAAPMGPDAFTSPAEIVTRCEPREIEIDAEALVRALTSDIIEECSRTPERLHVVPVAECRRRPLPVFLVSGDNAQNLAQTIASLQRQDPAVEILVYDDGSCDPHTVELLDAVQKAGTTIYRRAGSGPSSRLERVNSAVRNFFDDWAEPSRYAIADCTHEAVPLAAGAIALYDDLLDRVPRVDSVGPAISIAGDDRATAPTAAKYPIRHVPARTETCTCAIVEGGYEVGFAVYRAGKPLAGVMQSLRVCRA